MDSLVVTTLLILGVALVPQRYLVSLIPTWLRPNSSLPSLLDAIVLLGVLCFLALVAMNPEARILFVALEALGLDMFVLLVTLQLRGLLPLLGGVRDWWYRQLWLPGYKLNLQGARELPLVAVYAVVVPICVIWSISYIALQCAQCSAP